MLHSMLRAAASASSGGETFPVLRYTGGGLSGSAIVDEMGNYDGTALGVSLVSTPGGDALGFNGSTSNVRVDDPNFLSGVTTFTFVADILFSSGTADQEILSKGRHSGGEPVVFWFDYGSPTRYSVIFTGSNGVSSGALHSDATPAVGTETNIRLVFVGGAYVRLFIDGVEDANSPFPIPNVPDVGTSSAEGSPVVTLGAARYASTIFKVLDGYMNNVEFYLGEVY